MRKAFFSADGNEFTPVSIHRKDRISLQPFCRKSGFQYQPSPVRNQHADFITVCVQPVNFAVIDSAPAGDPAVQSLPDDLGRPHGLSPVCNLINTLQRKHPLKPVYGPGGSILHCPVVMESKAHSDGLIHLVHVFLVQPAHMLPEPLFVDGADLFQQNHRILA